MKPMELRVLPPEARLTLQEFLAQRLKLSRNRAKGYLDERNTGFGPAIWSAFCVWLPPRLPVNRQHLRWCARKTSII